MNLAPAYFKRLWRTLFVSASLKKECYVKATEKLWTLKQLHVLPGKTLPEAVNWSSGAAVSNKAVEVIYLKN